MDIPNLSSDQPILKPTYSVSLPVIIFIVLFSLVSGFWISRFFPTRSSATTTGSNPLAGSQTPVKLNDVATQSDIKIGQLYGNTGQTFKDTAQGTIEKGNINGEGTHILKRTGGDTQSVSLTSSSVDLDLFEGKKVEIRGETNSSKKTGWLIDVGTIKILE